MDAEGEKESRQEHSMITWNLAPGPPPPVAPLPGATARYSTAAGGIQNGTWQLSPCLNTFLASFEPLPELSCEFSARAPSSRSDPSGLSWSKRTDSFTRDLDIRTL